jgi:peptidoglycan/xylan/chitin deacetylase (PgdA/CDA1 family)
VKKQLRRLLGQTMFGAGLEAVLLRNSALVVAFHRVRDTSRPEPLTVSVQCFEEYCRFFKQHFRVVALGDLVTRLAGGLTPHRELAITFDDGYLDNHDNAAPILEALELPATFFIVTGWMGSDVVPWWDRMEDTRHPWMTWDHVRALHRRGFGIGAHTRTHADLGAVGEDQARAEILGARSELQRQLGAPVDLFAYPYGRRDNLTDAHRDLVRSAGFRCCCSCFGGVNTRGTDPFRLARVAVTPRYECPEHLGFEVAVGRSVLGAAPAADLFSATGSPLCRREHRAT